MPDSLFVCLSSAGPARDLALPTRQQPYWDEHAAFIDRLVADGRIALGGPLPDEGGALLVVRAADERAVRELLATDPWYVRGVLRLDAVKRWEIFIDELP